MPLEFCKNLNVSKHFVSNIVDMDVFCLLVVTREASLKRHLEYDHKEGSDDDIGDDDDDYQEVDDEDQEYKPNLAVVKVSHS